MLKPMQVLKTRDAAMIMVVAFWLPYVFAHVWWLRLICIMVVSITLAYEILRQVIYTNLMFRDDKLWNPLAKKIFIWFARILLIAILPILVYFGILIPGKDALSALTQNGPVVNEINVLHDDDETGFTRLVLQSLEVAGETKRLPLYFPLLRNGDQYEITHFPDSYLIYDAQPAQQ